MNGGAGKGDTRRPSQVSEDEVQRRWDYAFRKEDLELSYEEWLEKREESCSKRETR